jgi:SAM-dependent methyltransferase
LRGGVAVADPLSAAPCLCSNRQMTDWLPLQAHYERCLAQAGVTPAGVDWPNSRDLEERFAVQLGILDGMPPASELPSLMDLGCGPGLLLDYLTAIGRAASVRYQGIDISPLMIERARTRWTDQPFQVRDILAEPLPDQSVDVVIMNGVLTERQGIAREQMVRMAEALLSAAFQTARHGIVFNAMSRHVDWERDDLFHWGFDEVAAFLTRSLTRHIAIRADYGLYEFSAFAWRHPRRLAPGIDHAWWAR